MIFSGFPGGKGGFRGCPSNIGGGGGTNSGNISPAWPLGGGGGLMVAYIGYFPEASGGAGTAAITIVG